MANFSTDKKDSLPAASLFPDGLLSPGDTRGWRVIKFIEKHCRVPEGKLVGNPMRLLDFQKRFILDVYDNSRARTTDGILSIARKNGKSGLIAAIMLAHLVGPEAVQNSQIVSGALSRDQASIIFRLASQMASLSPTLQHLVKPIASKKVLMGLPMNVEYRALAAEGKTAHGLSPILVILDEMGQIKAEGNEFVDALVTAQGAHESPLTLTISTQAANDGAMLSRWIDDAIENDPANVVCHVYAAIDNCSLLSEAAWEDANPALGVFRSKADVLNNAEKATRRPSFAPSFRNLFLNQRVEVFSPFVSKDTWQLNSAPPDPALVEVWYGGLDLSSVADLTAFVLAGEDASGLIHVVPFFWLPGEGLKDRSKADRVPYNVWAGEGKLKTTPGKTVQYKTAAEDIKRILSRYNVQRIGFDPWNMRHFKPWMVDPNFKEDQFDKLFSPFKQSYAHYTPALRMLEENLLDNKLAHGNHPVLSMCAANAVVQSDTAGNRMLAKNKSTGRIDGMAALAMAVGVMPDDKPDEETYLASGEGIIFL